ELLLLLSRATLLQAMGVRETAQKNSQLREALRWNLLAQTLSPPDSPCQALLTQQAELMQQLGQEAEAQRLRTAAASVRLQRPMDQYLVGKERVAQGRYREALPLLQSAAEQDSENFWHHLVLGLCYDGLEQHRDARACYTTGIALWPEFPWAYFNRGLVCLRQ